MGVGGGSHFHHRGFSFFGVDFKTVIDGTVIVIVSSGPADISSFSKGNPDAQKSKPVTDKNHNKSPR